MLAKIRWVWTVSMAETRVTLEEGGFTEESPPAAGPVGKPGGIFWIND